MHEASLVQGILNLALESWRNYNELNPDLPAGRIKRISLSYGLLACFEAETLRACFELFAENTIAEKAELQLSCEALASQCENCGHKFELTKRHFVCPVCGSEQISFKGGNGLTLQSIEVENEEKLND